MIALSKRHARRVGSGTAGTCSQEPVKRATEVVKEDLTRTPSDWGYRDVCCASNRHVESR